VSEGTSGTPGRSWWRKPLDDCVGFIKEHSGLVEVTRAAVARTVNEPALVEALVRFDRQSLAGWTAGDAEDAEGDAQIARAHEEAAFAQREVASGFTLLHAHAVVLVWSALETAVLDLCVASLRNVPSLLGTDELQRVRVPLAQFMASGEDERAEVLVAALERDGRVQATHGIARLESLLGLVGLEGEMDDPQLREDLHTLNQIRNLVAHRRGVVDRRFLMSCRPVGGVLGERLAIHWDLYMRLQLAAVHYVFVIHNRCCRVHGGARPLVWEFGAHGDEHVAIPFPEGSGDQNPESRRDS